jgi:hypothetical protein
VNRSMPPVNAAFGDKNLFREDTGLLAEMDSVAERREGEREREREKETVI